MPNYNANDRICDWQGCDRPAKRHLIGKVYCWRCFRRMEKLGSRKVELDVIKGMLEEQMISEKTEAKIDQCMRQIEQMELSIAHCAHVRSLGTNLQVNRRWLQEENSIEKELYLELLNLWELGKGGDEMASRDTPEKRFQEAVRGEMEARKWKTYKMVGKIALPGMPDVLFLTDKGMLGFFEAKAGMPGTDQQCYRLLTGAERKVTLDFRRLGAPSMILVGCKNKGEPGVGALCEINNFMVPEVAHVALLYVGITQVVDLVEQFMINHYERAISECSGATVTMSVSPPKEI